MPSHSTSPARRALPILGVLAVALLLSTLGIALVTDEEPAAPPWPGSDTVSPPTPTPSPSASETPSPSPHDTPSPTPTPSNVAVLEESFAALESEHDGEVAVALTAVGAEAEPMTFGALDSPEAWSTMKVPIAVAVERTDAAEDLRSTMEAAISSSDNDAAQTLWDALGSSSSAREATQDVIDDYGAASTETGPVLIEETGTEFGMLAWSVGDQARFAAALPCDSEAAPVYEAMGEITEEHAWGLGQFDGAHFKGGWGDDEEGSDVRQLGVIDTAAGSVGVAIAYQGSDYDEGVAALDDTATWLQENVDHLPAGSC